MCRISLVACCRLLLLHPMSKASQWMVGRILTPMMGMVPTMDLTFVVRRNRRGAGGSWTGRRVALVEGRPLGEGMCEELPMVEVNRPGKRKNPALIQLRRYLQTAMTVSLRGTGTSPVPKVQR